MTARATHPHPSTGLGVQTRCPDSPGLVCRWRAVSVRSRSHLDAAKCACADSAHTSRSFQCHSRKRNGHSLIARKPRGIVLFCEANRPAEDPVRIPAITSSPTVFFPNPALRTYLPSRPIALATHGSASPTSTREKSLLVWDRRAAHRRTRSGRARSIVPLTPIERCGRTLLPR